MLTSRLFATVLGAVALALASPLSLAPLYVPDASPADIINNTYLVMLRDDIPQDAFQAHLQFLTFANGMHPLQPASNEDFELDHVYNSVIARGYAGRFSEAVLEMIRRRPEVRYVEQDRKIHPDVEQRSPPWVRFSIYWIDCSC